MTFNRKADAAKRWSLVGRIFGRWKVLARAENASGVSRYFCRCSCGETATVYAMHLRSGRSESCGCLRGEQIGERSTKHNQAHRGEQTSTYRTWCSMWSRTRATKGEMFKKYGSRGITVCERWLNFENFLADMGERPTGMTIDRVDNDGNYEPGNCRLATDSQQQHNTRLSSQNTSGIRGVHRNGRKWVAQISVNGVQMKIGAFNDMQSAGRAYRAARERLIPRPQTEQQKRGNT